MTTVTAALLLLVSLGVSAWSFRGIIRRYRSLRGFPWIVSIAFAAAAMVSVFALHILLRP